MTSISDPTEAENRAKDHFDIVLKSFPDVACLRCGNREFGVMPNLSGPSGIGVVTLACNRCGHLEQHLIGTLRQAIREGKAPIPLEKAIDEQ
jgi:hypothetical protein